MTAKVLEYWRGRRDLFPRLSRSLPLPSSRNHQNKARYTHDASISISTVAHNCHGKSNLVWSLFIFIRNFTVCRRISGFGRCHVQYNIDRDQKKPVSTILIYSKFRNEIADSILFSGGQQKKLWWCPGFIRLVYNFFSRKSFGTFVANGHPVFYALHFHRALGCQNIYVVTEILRIRKGLENYLCGGPTHLFLQHMNLFNESSRN